MTGVCFPCLGEAIDGADQNQAVSLGDEDVADIVRRFAGAALDPARWDPAMVALQTGVGAACCALELTDTTTGAVVIKNTCGLDDAIRREYEDRIFHINPRVARGMAMAVGEVADDSRLLFEDDPDRAEFLDWLERTPYYHLLGSKILGDNGQVGFLTVNHAKAHGPSTDAHRRLFALLTPHMLNIVAMARLFSANRLSGDLVTYAALESDRPFALLDRNGQVIECSAGFETLLRSAGVLAVRRGRLAAVQPQHRHLVERFVAAACGARRCLEPPRPARLAAPHTPLGLVLRALPIAPGDDLFDIFRPATLVTLTDLDRPRRIRRQDLIELFALTGREADIASMIGEGLTIELIAHHLAIGEHTVRQHLKAVFAKVGVSRQAELVATLSRVS